MLATAFGGLRAAQPAYCVVDLADENAGKAFSMTLQAELPADFNSNSNTYKSGKIVLKWIAAEEFTMGQSRIAMPVHSVSLSEGYYLGLFEITQSQWTNVMGDALFQFTNQPHAPAEKLSWEDIRGSAERYDWPQTKEVDPASFMGRMNARTGSQYAFDLPTEAQWEHACRAGTTTQWSFGDSEHEADDYAWYERTSSRSTHDVGLKKANPFGLFDMHGNVWEWCLDRYGSYPREAQTDPPGATSGWYRVWRGGGWGSSDMVIRSAQRSGHTPDSRAIHAGFRLVMTIDR